ncbi:MAG: tetratricopeptide repeat protein, partial [Candidatus Eremiobacterota bacterium]
MSLQQAHIHRKEGRLGSALVALRNLPANSDVRREREAVYLQIGEPIPGTGYQCAPSLKVRMKWVPEGEQREVLDRYVHRRPGSIDAVLLRSQVALREGDHRQAVADALLGLEKPGGMPEGRDILGQALFRAGSLVPALTCLSRSEIPGVQVFTVLALVGLRRLGDALKLALSLRHEPAMLGLLPLLWMDAGRPEEAAEAYRQAERAAPDDPAVRLRWAQCLARAGLHEQAGSFFSQAVRLAPAPALAERLGRASWLASSGGYSDALEALQQLSGHPAAGKLMASVYLALRRPAEALHALEAQEDAEGLRLRANAHEMLGHFEQARADRVRAEAPVFLSRPTVGRGEPHPEAAELVARAQSVPREEAIERLLLALELDPGCGAAYRARAQHRTCPVERARDLELAATLGEQVPRSELLELGLLDALLAQEPAESRGYFLVQACRWEQALEALDGCPETPRAAALKAACLHQLGRREETSRWLQDAEALQNLSLLAEVYLLCDLPLRALEVLEACGPEFWILRVRALEAAGRGLEAERLLEGNEDPWARAALA